MERKKQWYVIYTRPGLEQRVCDSLRRKKMDSFYPVNKMVKTSAGKERSSFKPLLERFVFVCTSYEQLSGVKNIKGIVSFVHWLSQPVVIESDDIYLMKRFCNIHDDIRLEKVKVSAEPAFISSQFTGQNSELISLHFPVLGYNMTAEERQANVKVITLNDYQNKPEISKSKYAETR